MQHGNCAEEYGFSCISHSGVSMNDYTATDSVEILQKIDDFRKSFEQRMALSIAYDPESASKLDKFRALAFAVRDELIKKWLKTRKTYQEKDVKRVYYFSLEFLIGRTLGNALINLDITDIVQSALESLGYSLENLAEVETDAGLGNGGLGRLAACFLDSMATLELPAFGYGIRYEFGMFHQTIEDMHQKENPDNWLRYGNPWEIQRTAHEYKVHFMGKIANYTDHAGKTHNTWVDTETVNAIGFIIPIPGFKTNTVNTLKLWSATSSAEFNLHTFNAGDYIGAMIDKSHSESISKILYPNDNNYKGKELRLKQQYFMVSASLQDILNDMRNSGHEIANLPKKIVIQLNDTHPSIAIVELMRILMDNCQYGWNDAWAIVTKVFAYTNHTVLPEALEKWPVDMVQKVLPRHMQIIFKINQKFLDTVAVTFPGDFDFRNRISIIEDGDPQYVRMSHLAIVGSFSVNGVAEIHSKLLKEGIFKDFYQIYPEKFNNKTNGITPRRWLRKANPELSGLITEKIGDGWVKDLPQIKAIEAHRNDEEFVSRWMDIKKTNKQKLAAYIEHACDIRVNPDSIFDIQVKRIHEYKRQLLNILHVIYMYNLIRLGQAENFSPRTVIFGGKAAPGYKMAKDIIFLINSVANIVNNDPRMGNLLKVVFIPNYSVPAAMSIIPAADLSEQISTAGMEASGTGNMKFALNGALTIGTLDGANIEIMEEVKKENIFIFGHTVEEIAEKRKRGYNPYELYENDENLRTILDQIKDGFFSPSNATQFAHIFDSLVHHGDHYFILADFPLYVECQHNVSKIFQNRTDWHKMAILNVARIGKFSSDRVIREYAEDIWKVEACPVT